MSTLTARQKELKNKYTRTCQFNGKYHAFLEIDHQGFALAQDTTKGRALWFCNMLAIALDRLIKTERGNDE